MYRKNLFLVVFFCLFACMPFFSSDLSAARGVGGGVGMHGGMGRGNFNMGHHGNFYGNRNFYNRDYYSRDYNYGGYPYYSYDNSYSYYPYNSYYPYDSYYYDYPYYDSGFGVNIGGTGLYFNG